LDIKHIDGQHFDDYVKGKITTIDSQDGESMDYDIKDEET